MKTRSLFRGVIVLILLFCVASDVAIYGATPTSSRPKIGLVLSGGGARGVAHIGVLKALEELQIPVDYIAGTSMGAVVGALYATGMSPEEIEKWVNDADWSFLLSDVAPRESESFRSKQREFDLNQNLQLGVSLNGVKLPAGAIQGRNLMATFRELTVPVRNVHDFDQFPIPFRAVAADIETGNLVVRRKGALAEAMRASMAVPGIFSPWTIDGQLLVDGGVASNLPIRVMRDEMKPDLIIAVDCSPQFRKAAELNDALLIAEQMFAILISKETRKDVAQLGPKDVYLRLEVKDIGPTEFVRAAGTIDRGYQRTMDRREELERFSAGPGAFHEFLRRQRAPHAEGVPISFIEVHTPFASTEHILKKPLPLSTLHPANFAPLQSAIGDLPEMQRFEVADYEIVDKDGVQGVRVVARERKSGRNVVSLGLDYSYSSSGETDVNLLLAYRMSELNSLGAEWNTYLSLGDSNRALTEWYQPVDPGRRFFLAPQLSYINEFTDGVDSAGDPIRFRLQTIGAGFDVGMRLGQVGEIRAGLGRAISRSGRRLGNLDDLAGQIDRGWAHLEAVYDTLDARSFSTRGTYGRVSLVASREELGADDNYTRLDGQLYKAFTFGKNTIVPRVSAGLKLGGNDIPVYDRFALGGFLQLSGLARGDLYDQNAVFAELIYYRKIAELSPSVGRGVYAGFSLEGGEVAPDVGDLRFRDVVFGGSAFIGADTVIGPIHFGIGMAEAGEAAVYLHLGPVFPAGLNR